MVVHIKIVCLNVGIGEKITIEFLAKSLQKRTNFWLQILCSELSCPPASKLMF